MVLVEEWKTKKHKKDDVIEKVSKQALEIRFDKLFDNDELKSLNTFIIKPKQAYYNNTELYCPYLNYFIKFYDDDKELLTAYLKLKIMCDRNKKYPKEVFLDDLYSYILSDEMRDKIERMVDDNYEVQLTPKRNFKKNSIKFDDIHGKVLLSIGMAIKMFIPIVSHYIFINGIKDTDKFLYECFEPVFNYFGTEINLYNKLYEFILDKLNKLKKKNKGHYNRVEILGIDIDYETETIFMRVLVDIVYQYIFSKNIIAFNTTAIRKNINWGYRTNSKLNLKSISDIKSEDGLSGLDKIEMTMAKFDESNIIMADINVKQTLKKLANKFDVKFDNDEVAYYMEHLSIDTIQKNLIFQLFGKYFNNINDLYSLSKKQYCKLIIILKKLLKIHGFRIMQHVLTADIIKSSTKRIPKKIINKIEESDRFQLLKDEYPFTFDLIYNSENALNLYISTIINSKFYLVDYDNKDKTGSEILINKNIDILLDELLRLIKMI